MSRIRVIIKPNQRWGIVLGPERTAEIRRGWDLARGDWTGDYHWTAEGPDGAVSTGTRASWDEALVSAACAVVIPEPPLELDREELAGLAASAERGLALGAAKVIRRLLALRTTTRFSVRVERNGLGVRVTGTKARLVKGGLTLADRVALAAVFGGRPSRDGVKIEHSRGHRSAAVWQVAGLPPPAGTRAWAEISSMRNA